MASEIWRTQERLIPEKERHFALSKCPYDEFCMEYPDKVVDDEKMMIVYHRNEHSIYPFTIQNQELEVSEDEIKDPFIKRTMGYGIYGECFKKVSPSLLISDDKTDGFLLKVATHVEQTETSDEWICKVKNFIYGEESFEDVSERTSAWWNDYWDKSYIVVETPDRVTGYNITRAYVLQKWMLACAGRGNYPIKFNGSIFTVDPVFTKKDCNYNPDYRLWGPDYWWQNTRLMYHPMFKSGDFDIMKVLFRHYISILPVLKENARVIWNSEGAVNPETATIFGSFVNHDYGWEKKHQRDEVIDNPYVRYY